MNRLSRVCFLPPESVQADDRERAVPGVAVCRTAVHRLAADSPPTSSVRSRWRQKTFLWTGMQPTSRHALSCLLSFRLPNPLPRHWTVCSVKAGLHVRRKYKHKHKPRVNRDDASTSARKRNAHLCSCLRRTCKPALTVNIPVSVLNCYFLIAGTEGHRGRLLPCGHVEFKSAVAQNDEFKGSFVARSMVSLAIRTDKNGSIYLSQHKLCARKIGLALGVKRHGHDGERWPTEVTSNTYFCGVICKVSDCVKSVYEGCVDV